MNRTSIEYVDFSWSPITGCLGPGGTPEEPKRCPYCYAHRLAKGRLRPLYLSNPHVAPGCDPDDPFSPRLWPKRLDQPIKRKKSAKVFVVNMGDLFQNCLPREWFYEIGAVATTTIQHTFIYLTKNPIGYKWPMGYEAIGSWGWESHEWLGITVTNQHDWDERWPVLAEVNSAVRFVSFEPLLGPVEMGRGELPDWIIIGAQTRPEWQPRLQWVNALQSQADLMDVPVFLKGNLDLLPLQQRQEYPRARIR